MSLRPQGSQQPWRKTLYILIYACGVLNHVLGFLAVTPQSAQSVTQVIVQFLQSETASSAG